MYVFSFNNKNLIKIMKDDFSFVIQSIWRNCDEHTVGILMYTLYVTIASNKFVSIDIINSILPTMPDRFDDNFKLMLYTLVGMTHVNLSKHQEAIEWYDKALVVDRKNVFALYGKGSTLHNLRQISRSYRVGMIKL